MQTINLDISCCADTPQPMLQTKQGDVGRKFKALITDNGQPYPIAAGVTVTIWYSGTSGEGNYTRVGTRSAASVSENAVTVELIAQMLTAPGGGTLCLILHSPTGEQLGLWNIHYWVEPVPGADSAEADAYYTALSETTAQVLEAAKKLTFPVAVANGGTGATTKEKALENLGAAPATYANNLMNGAYDAAAQGKSLDIIIDEEVAAMPADSLRHISIMSYGRHSVTIHKHLPGYADVEDLSYSYAIGYSTYYQKRVRSMFNGTWGEWEYVNPPMVLGTEYRTTQRWQGKAVYTKQVNCGNLLNCSVAGTAHGAQATSVIRAAGTASDGKVLPFCYDAAKIYVSADRNNIHLTSTYDASKLTATVQIWYIKD